MDKRIGYGLTLKEALYLAYKAIDDLPDKTTEIDIFSLGNQEIWAELRTDGWRVYREKTDDEFHLDDSTTFGSFSKQGKKVKIWCTECEEYEEQEIVFQTKEWWITYCPNHKEYIAHTVEFEGDPSFNSDTERKQE